MQLQTDIQAAVKKVLPGVEAVIGWGAGPTALQYEPLFMRNEADVALCSPGFFAVHNTALYVPEYKGKKIAVVAKGCDARSLFQLVQEGLVKREEIVVIGFACHGVIDHQKLAVLLAEKNGIEPGMVTEVKEEATQLVLVHGTGTITVAKTDVLAEKCQRCRYPNALQADIFVGEEKQAVVEEDTFADLEKFEEMSLEERFDFWEKEMSRCIRCYACRSACPLCVCRDHCVATSRDPAWVTQADSVKDKLFFQIIQASHLAGRCTGCGECERACPVGIPVLLLKRSLSRSVEKLFHYTAGVDAGTPPLMTFTLEEPTIKERDW